MDWPGISNQVKQVIISSQELGAGLSAWRASPRQKEVADSKRSLKPFPSTNTTRAPIACLNAVWRRPWRSFSVFHGTFHKWQAWCLAGLVNKQQHLISSLFSDSSSKMARFNDVMVAVGSDSCDCLPDCEATEYQYAVTSSSLRLRNTLNVNLTWDTFQRSCDSRNLNLEPLCTLETGPSPKLWLEEVVFKTFKKSFFWLKKLL